jgi:hypothetical protein
MPFKIDELPLTDDPYSHERMSFLKTQNALDLALLWQIFETAGIFGIPSDCFA